MDVMKRIAIVGCAGTGKTYLAQKLHSRLKLPLYHLDQYYWKPNWVRPDFEEFRKIHNELCDEPEWIIDGLLFQVMTSRFDEADTIIFLDIPWRVYFWRVVKRTLLNYGKVLPTSAPQCMERFGWEFWEFAKWMWRFQDQKRPYLITMLNIMQKEYNKKVYTLRSQKEVDAFITSIK